MAVSDKIRVMVAHGNPLVSAGLEVAFKAQEDFEVFACDPGSHCATAAEARLEAANVAVTDCEIGLRLVASATGRQCRVLIITEDESEASIRRAVEMGAGGYLLLKSSLESVVRGVRTVHDGGTPLDPLVTTKMVASLSGPPLTRRELDVLRLMMVGLSDKGIAKRLARSVGTAKTHVKAILAKLDCASRTAAVAVARRRGLVSEGPPLAESCILASPNVTTVLPARILSHERRRRRVPDAPRVVEGIAVAR
jgi:DNA-binding NarL/FixJ family response regulator